MVKLYGTLSKPHPDHNPGTGSVFEIQEGATIRDLTERLNLDQDGIGMISINGELAKAHNRIKEGDDVKIFQPISGG